MEADAPSPIFLYDGVCALCNWMVRFILSRDAAATFRFASLQNEFAKETLTRHGRNPGELRTVVVVIDHGRPTERLLDESDAAIFALKRLPGIWQVAGRLMQVVPKALRNFAYRAVARTRYRAFGKYEACPIPVAEHRGRFLDR